MLNVRADWARKRHRPSFGGSLSSIPLTGQALAFVRGNRNGRRDSRALNRHFSGFDDGTSDARSNDSYRHVALRYRVAIRPTAWTREGLVEAMRRWPVAGG
jgi:hypothetical protein